MLYTILCYNSEQNVGSWSKEHEAAVMEKLIAVQAKLARRGKLGPVARLAGTATATSVRKDRAPFLLTDGPYAETKEQILGFYVVDLDSREEAIEFARELSEVNPGGGYEIRPMIYFSANDALPNATLAESFGAVP